MSSENKSSNWMVFQGSIAHSTRDKHLVSMENRLLGVNKGKIEFLEVASELKRLQEEHNFNSACIQHMNQNEFLIPGFIDTHIHAPQYANVGGVGNGQPLLDWLQNYTFPTEARFKDLTYADNIFRKAVRRTLANGTTTAVYYSTSHLEVTLRLWQIIEEEGQRAFVGKINSDKGKPEWYAESTKDSIDDTKCFIENVLKRKNPLITPIITPGSAFSCTEELMKSLADLSQTYHIPIQTHISENKEEVQLVKSQYPDTNYAGVYNQYGLLTDKTILAHGIHLSDDELNLIKQQGSKLSHCPTSNISLISGLCDVRRIQDKGIPVGLGTDVSGGYSPSILDAMRHAIATSNIIGMDKGSNYRLINHEEAFFLATLGGSQVVGLEDKLGNFEVGKDFDALLIDPTVADGPFDTFPDDDLKTKIQKFIYLGDDRNITKVFVNGIEVKAAKSCSI